MPLVLGDFNSGVGSASAVAPREWGGALGRHGLGALNAAGEELLRFSVDRRLSGPWWAHVDAGMQFGQEIEIVGGGYHFSQELDSAAYLATGIRVRF